MTCCTILSPFWVNLCPPPRQVSYLNRTLLLMLFLIDNYLSLQPLLHTASYSTWFNISSSELRVPAMRYDDLLLYYLSLLLYLSNEAVYYMTIVLHWCDSVWLYSIWFILFDMPSLTSPVYCSTVIFIWNTLTALVIAPTLFLLIFLLYPMQSYPVLFYVIPCLPCVFHSDI